MSVCSVISIDEFQRDPRRQQIVDEMHAMMGVAPHPFRQNCRMGHGRNRLALVVCRRGFRLLYRLDRSAAIQRGFARRFVVPTVETGHQPRLNFQSPIPLSSFAKVAADKDPSNSEGNVTRNLVLSAALLAATAIATPATAATSPTLSNSLGSGHGVILSPLTFVNDTNVNFGSVVLPVGVGGAVELNPDPTVTNFVTNTGVLPIPTSTPTRGLMVGAGTAGSNVTVTTAFPDKLYLNGVISSPTFLAVALNVDAVATALNTYTYTIDSGQVFQVHVGGRVDIPVGTSNGSYSNVYTVTATYP